MSEKRGPTARWLSGSQRSGDPSLQSSLGSGSRKLPEGERWEQQGQDVLSSSKNRSGMRAGQGKRRKKKKENKEEAVRTKTGAGDREGVVTGRGSRQVSSCAPARLLGPSPPALESTSGAEVLTPLCVLLCVSLSLNCPYTHDSCHHRPTNSPWLVQSPKPTNPSHTPRHTTWATQIIPPLHTPPTPSIGVFSKGTLLVPRVQIPFLPQ